MDMEHRKILAARIGREYVPKMSDSAMAMQELHDLLMQDYTVSEEKKSLLCKDYMNLSCGYTVQALECFQKALSIFTKIYENEPALLAEKKAEIAPVLQMVKLSTVNYPMLNG